MEALTTHSLTKRYGDVTVVEDLSLTVPAGCVYGFLGPNGSGKTTTMKMMISLARPSAGEVRIFGEPVTRRSRADVLSHVGSLIESPSAYGHLTGAENMRIIDRLVGAGKDNCARAVAAVRMENHLTKRVREYSLGMKQRLGIAMALARDPQLLILDEPTNGLDPSGIEEIRDLLVHLAHDQGRTVIVSSHQLAEVEKMSDVLGILQRGRLLFQGSMVELFDAQLPDLLIRTPQPVEAARALTTLEPELVTEPGPGRGEDLPSVRLSGLDRADGAQVVAHLVACNIDIWEVRREQRSLEEVFIGLTGREGVA